MVKKFSEVKTENLMIVILILTVLPFIVLHYYNHPTSEEFFYGEETKRLGFIESQRELFGHWGGRYFTYVFLSINPLLFKSLAGYKIATLVLMIALFFGTFLFVSEVCKGSLGLRERILSSLSIFVLYLYAMPSVSQGFYWYGSAVCYHLSLIMILIFSIFYLRLSNEAGNGGTVFYTVLCCLTIAAIAGSNELSATFILMFVVLLAVRNIFFDRRLKWSSLLLLFTTVLSIYISFSAPGNRERSGLYKQNHQLFFSIYNSFIFLIEHLFSWIFETPLLAFTLLLFPLFARILTKRGPNTDLFFINPLYTLVAGLIFLYSSTFILLWSVGITPYDRILNFIYFMFLMVWFYNIIVLTAFANKRYKINVLKIPRFVYAAAFIIIVFFLFRENNIKTAYAELLGGDARNYDAELDRRYDDLLQSKSDSCQVDSISNIPKSFFLLDITTDPEIFYNQGLARYFNKESIILKKSGDENK